MKHYGALTIILGLILAASQAYAIAPHTPLTTTTEKTIFSFKVRNSTRIMSLSVATTEPQYLVYRYGTPQRIELEFPSRQQDSWSKFTYSYYFRGGGAANDGLKLQHLTFMNGDYKYQIYQDYSARANRNTIGILIYQGEKQVAEIEGDFTSLIGSLDYFETESRVRQYNELIGE